MSSPLSTPLRRRKAHHKKPSDKSLTIKRIKDKDFHLGVIGLGYVGLPLSLRFASQGIKVLGFDVDQSKISQLNKGNSYLPHLSQKGLDKAIKGDLFQACSDFSLVASCQVIVICVPTPLTKHLEPDLTYVIQTCEAIGPHLKLPTLVSLESTTWPGTTDEVLTPLLEKHSNLKVGKNLFICFSPEREDPGNPAFHTHNIPKVLGGINAKSLDLSKAFYEIGIEKVVAVNTSKEAEASKLLENIFRSVNIALVNELKMVFDKMDIDIWKVIEAASTKPFGYMPFWPGPGLGGHCIPIDPFYLSWKAKEQGVATQFIELAGQINRSMPQWVLGKVQDCLNHYEKALKGSRILVLGIAYKSDIGDMRESPSLEIIDLLEEKGAKVDYHDPHIPVIPQNRDHPHLKDRASCPYSQDYDCFILATYHKIFNLQAIEELKVPIVDTRNVFKNSERIFKA